MIPLPVVRAVGRCPACGEALEVRKLGCPACGTTVKGHFLPPPYAALPEEQSAFLEVFLRARGNLREVERILGLSYPSVRARLDALLLALGLAGDEDEAADARQDALQALARGEITASEAAARIRGDG